jgi:hypothetical protein
MEELDLLKKDWKRTENSFSQISEKDIYNMIHHKSSSIVKWILIISILEVLIWTSIGFLYSSDDYLKQFGHEVLVVFQQIIAYVNYAVVLVFIYLFYTNYVNISTTSNTRKLMKDILKTRKTVKYYVWYNLIMITVSLISGMLLALWYSPQGILLREKMEHEGKVMVLIIVVLSLIVLVSIAIFWLIYRVLYGILLRKLIKNYKILEQIDFDSSL